MLNAYRITLAPLTNNFKKAIRGKANAEDKKTLKTAKSKVLEQTKPYLQKILSGSIQSRDLSKLKAAINEVFLSTQEDICLEYLCNRSPKIKTKHIKIYSLVLTMVNHRNWLDNSPP